METSISLVWSDGMAFYADVDGHRVNVDAQSGDSLSQGPSPKKLLMVSLAGCTGMDVVSILNKMRVRFTKFSVDVEAVVADEHPKKYVRIVLDYRLDASADDKEKIVKAIELSRERYCGVWNTLAPAVPIDYRITLL